MKLFPVLLLVLASPALFAADVPADVKPIPPPGIEVPADIRAELTAGVDALGKEIESLRRDLPHVFVIEGLDQPGQKPDLRALLPDVEIFHKSVDWALRYNEFFDAKQFDAAKKELALGMERAKALHEGKAPWNEQTGLVVRGYRSRIDNSVQPYGLVIPDDWKASDKTPRRLDFWLHGRGEKLSELSFLEDRMKNKGEFTPENAIVLHLYGRYCCANKFAGEQDLFEALKDARSHYPIDMRRLVVRGFSMGGASAWQFGTHHAGMWAAVAPGAGFAETAEFFHSFAPGKEPPPWWEQVLWRWYDSTIYSANLANTTTVAYSGEIDGQKQAADIMTRYAEKEGITFPHIIGPQTAHKYHPEAKPKIEELVTKAAVEGRPELPKHVHFTTYSLRYPRLNWVFVTGLEKQWERADLDATLDPATNRVTVATKNVSSLSLAWSSSMESFSDWTKVSVVIDGVPIPGGLNAFKGGFTCHFEKSAGKWIRVEGLTSPEGDLQPSIAPFDDQPVENPSLNASLSERSPILRKLPALSGPIDDAFMSRFVMVRPTGKPLNDSVGKWTASELNHATDFWRKTFRGDAPVVDDRALSDEQIKNANLILWGDPSSNAVLAKILPKLPIQWTKDALIVGKQKYDAANTAPILIFPNPLNPEHYVVINSGVTFRELALLNNSDQTPKLPDWAVVDLRTPPGPKWPGLVMDAGFFDEQWRFQQ